MMLLLLAVQLARSDAFGPFQVTQRANSLSRATILKSSNEAPEKQPIEYSDFLPQPNQQLEAIDIVHSCLSVLLDSRDAGLEVCFNFSSDRCRAALGGSLERFREYATTPVFGYLVNCNAYTIVSIGPEIAGTITRGAMRTVLMDAISADPQGTAHKEERRFLWTLQKERRPPWQDCWMIHEVIYVRNAFDLTT